MPIYEYRCQDCGHELESLQSMSEDPLTDCPECGKPELKRKISAAAFRLKGGGWYETDFKQDNRRNVAGEPKSGEKKEGDKKESGGKKDGGKSDSSKAKPEPGDAKAAGKKAAAGD